MGMLGSIDDIAGTARVRSCRPWPEPRQESPPAVRRAVRQALAKRRLDAHEDYARLQVARLTKALRCAAVSLEEGDLKAIAPFVKVVRELLYHGVDVAGRGALRRRSRRQLAACAHAFVWGGGYGSVRGRKAKPGKS